MIVKLMKGQYVLSVEADTVLQQATESGCVDLEVCRGGVTVRRVLIGETDEANAAAMKQKTKSMVVVADFAKAYLIENGKTVDCISRKY